MDRFFDALKDWWPTLIGCLIGLLISIAISAIVATLGGVIDWRS